LAIWQFSIAFLPDGAPAPVISEDGYEGAPLSEAATLQALESLISKFGASRTVLPNWQQFGLENGNRVDLSFEGERAELSARIDARDPQQMVTYVCSLASQLRCRFFLPEGHLVLEADEAQLQSALNQSGASRFVANPLGFLEGLAGAG
jgi:hypothetical protein